MKSPHDSATYRVQRTPALSSLLALRAIAKGGAIQVLTMAPRLVRNKAVALGIGPEGVGESNGAGTCDGPRHLVATRQPEPRA